MAARGKLVGTEKVEVDVYEYSAVNFIEYEPPFYHRWNDEYSDDGDDSPYCRWGKQNKDNRVEGFEVFDTTRGVCDVDLSEADDAIYYEGKIFFKTEKTIRTYVESRADKGLVDIVHIKVMRG